MKKILFIISIAFAISSCSKDGDPGATGPQGATGNANVKSQVYTVSPGQWQSLGTAGVDYEKYISFIYTDITSSVINSGAVLVYLVGTDGSIAQIPLSFPSGGNTVNFVPSAMENEAMVELFLGNYQVPNVTVNYSFKVVAIDGSARITHPEINWSDPFAIAKGLNIQ